MKSFYKYTITLSALLFFVPLFTHAAAGTMIDFSAIGATITNFNKEVVAIAATLFIALGVTAFFFGVTQFIFASRDADPKKMQNGKDFMLWSVIALFVMFSIYGIIRFGQGLIPGLNSTKIEIPVFDLGGGTTYSNPNSNTNNSGVASPACAQGYYRPTPTSDCILSTSSQAQQADPSTSGCMAGYYRPTPSSGCIPNGSTASQAQQADPTTGDCATGYYRPTPTSGCVATASGAQNADSSRADCATGYERVTPDSGCTPVPTCTDKYDEFGTYIGCF